MKVSQKYLSVILFVVAACLLVVAAIQLLRIPILIQNDWNGAHTIDTTTPTLTLFPANGWWISTPTKSIPTLWTPNPTWTPGPSWTPVPSWTDNSLPSPTP